MPSTPERRVVSTYLEGVLNAADMLSGCVLSPVGGGWQDDPAKDGSDFIAYSVITPGTGTPVNPSVNDSGQDWSLAYQITTYGVDDDQVEGRADEVRALVTAIKKVSLTMSDGNWRITEVRCSAMGGVGYTTAISPPAYSQTDSFTLTLSRSIA